MRRQKFSRLGFWKVHSPHQALSSPGAPPAPVHSNIAAVAQPGIPQSLPPPLLAAVFRMMQQAQCSAGRLAVAPCTQRPLSKVARVAATPVVQRSSSCAAPWRASNSRVLIITTAAASGFGGYGPQGGECWGGNHARTTQPVSWARRLTPSRGCCLAVQVMPASRWWAAAVAAATQLIA